MLGWCVQTTLIVAGLAVVTLGVGRFPGVGPAARHVMWLVVLCRLITPSVGAWPWAFTPAPTPDASPVRSAGPLSGMVSAILVPLDDTNGPQPHPDTNPEPEPEPEPNPEPATLDLAALTPWLLAVWLVGSLLVASAQVIRIVRFRRRLAGAQPAPNWLIAATERLAARLNVRAPEIAVVSGLATPLLWCLGRPRLLIPDHLLDRLDLEAWRGVLAHELAHLRRGDHWVKWLELAIGLVWWWAPLYWIVRHRLDAEAELACDAWVVWAFPEDRARYAEALYGIGAALSLDRSPAPVLEIRGAARSFERRLTMILRDRVSCRLSRPALIGACLLAVAGLPSWTAVARPTAATPDDPAGPIVRDLVLTVTSEDDDGPRPEAKPGKAKNDQKEDAFELGRSAVEKAFGPGSDFVKRMEQFGKEMESQFGEGSDFVKQMEQFGKEMESQFGEGSDFVKRMEQFGKEMESQFGEGSEFKNKLESQFGPGSDFVKRMERFGKEMESQFGEGSEFKKQMESLGKELGPKHGREFEKKIEEAIRKALKESREAAEKAAAEKPKTVEPRKRDLDRERPKRPDRERRIEELEARIKAMLRELEALKSADDEEHETR